MNNFSKLGLKKDILNVLSKLKLTRTFEVQEKIVPLIIKGKNIVFTSRTGSGKTLAYTLGFLGKINKKLGIQMIVLVPTRELCIQVKKEIENICEPLDIRVGALYGGREISGDYKTTQRKNHILIGTPGRLIQHVNEKTIKVGDVRYLVYDESDQMFDNGFYDECTYMKQRVSKDAQLILASATITDKVSRFADSEIGEFEFINVGLQIPKNITQEIRRYKIIEKNNALVKLFKEKRFKRAIVFCNTKAKTEGIAEFLKNKFIVSRALNSNLEQETRQNYLNLFKDGKIKVLVATDVASRGLHIENVDIVVNYDVPTRPEFYIHRIGRTGRGDKAGYSITFICPEDEERFELINDIYSLNLLE